MSDKIPSGVSAIFIADGRVIAHASDFNPSKPGGFTLREAQEHRARSALARAVICETCSTLISKNLTTYLCEQILDTLPGKVHVMAIGTPESEEKSHG